MQSDFYPCALLLLDVYPPPSILAFKSVITCCYADYVHLSATHIAAVMKHLCRIIHLVSVS